MTVGTRFGPTGVEVYQWNKFWWEGTYKDSPQTSLLSRWKRLKMPANHNEIEKRLWDAADELRANSKLKSTENDTGSARLGKAP